MNKNQRGLLVGGTVGIVCSMLLASVSPVTYSPFSFVLQVSLLAGAYYYFRTRPDA